jgi:hypothetical protein
MGRRQAVRLHAKALSGLIDEIRIGSVIQAVANVLLCVFSIPYMIAYRDPVGGGLRSGQADRC